MRPGYSPQFQTGVVIIEKRDYPLVEDDVIKTAREYEATKRDSDPEGEGDLFTVRFPDRFDEVYTEDALRRSIRHENENSVAE